LRTSAFRSSLRLGSQRLEFYSWLGSVLLLLFAFFVFGLFLLIGKNERAEQAKDDQGEERENETAFFHRSIGGWRDSVADCEIDGQSDSSRCEVTLIVL
jgi:hypothetical protein